MKNIAMNKATPRFQTIIENYRKKIKKKKSKKTLNTLFVQDLYRIKHHQNFSNEEDYFISEIKNENNNKNNNYLSLKEKISKDIFFYYQNKLDMRDKNKQISAQNFDRYNSRVTSGLKSEASNFTDNTCTSNKKSAKSLILPLIYKSNCLSRRNNNNLISNRSFVTGDDSSVGGQHRYNNNKTEVSEEIKCRGNKDEKLSIMDLKKIAHNLKMKRLEQQLFYKVKLPLFQNDIFNKINKVTNRSKNIKNKINHLSIEENLLYNNEKKCIRILSELLDG